MQAGNGILETVLNVGNGDGTAYGRYRYFM